MASLASADEDTIPADALAREAGTRVIAIVDAAQDFARNCAGCHGHRGVSVPQVPALKESPLVYQDFNSKVMADAERLKEQFC